MDLTTRYLGLTLPHPFMPGASPLTEDLDMVARLEDAGAAAIVMHSLFEEEILTYTSKPDDYLEQLLRIKQRVRVPVIASLNGTNSEGWLPTPGCSNRPGPPRSS
jgi:dihydroorotate dehydrogenase (fumarate)